MVALSTPMPRQYPPYVRREMVNKILSGGSILSLVEETSVSEQTLQRREYSALVDQGLADDVDSAKSAQLRAANKCARALQKELPLVGDAFKLFYAQRVVPPKGGRPRPKGRERVTVRFDMPPGCLG